MASCGGVEWHVRPPYPKNPIFFFNLTIGSIPVGRIKMELFADISPTTADNFRQLCTGEYSFFIACATCEWLDNKHVVFGRVPGDSLLVVRKIENVAIGPNNRPKLPCIIAECWEM